MSILPLSVSANDAYTEKEKAELAEAFGKAFGTTAKVYTYAEDSAEVLPPIIIFALGSVAGSILAGFLKAIGSDLWEAFKSKARSTISKPRRGGDSRIRIEFEYNGVKVSVGARTSDPETIDRIFDESKSVLQEVSEFVESKNVPAEKCQIHYSLSHDRKLSLDVAIVLSPNFGKYKFDYQNKKWVQLG